jgi:hypothetical protein
VRGGVRLHGGGPPLAAKGGVRRLEGGLPGGQASGRGKLRWAGSRMGLYTPGGARWGHASRKELPAGCTEVETGNEECMKIDIQSNFDKRDSVKMEKA